MTEELEKAAPDSTRIRFGAYELDYTTNVLTRGSIRLRVHSQPISVLKMLLAAPGEVVTRERLKQELWPANQYGDFDTGINSAVRKLRRALDDSADHPRWIETIPTVGYRFIGELNTPESGPGAPTVESAVSPKTWPRLALAAGVVALLCVGWILTHSETAGRRPSLHLELSPPDGLAHSAFSVSPDGTRLAIIENSSEPSLWVQSLVGNPAYEVEGSGGADPLGTPFWAPDSSAIGFFAQGKLKTVALASGLISTHCGAPDGRGGTWSEAGQIIFAPDTNSGLWIADLNADTCELFLQADPDTRGLRSPRFLPGERDLLFTQRRRDRGVAVAALSVGSGEVTTVAEGIEHAIYVGAGGGQGRLLYVRDGYLRARPYDVTKGETPPQETAIVGGVGFDRRMGRGMFDVSSSGVLIYAPSDYVQRSHGIRWINRQGETLRDVTAVRDTLGFSLHLAKNEEWALTLGWKNGSNGVIQREVNRLDLASGITTKIVDGALASFSSARDSIYFTNLTGLAEIAGSGLPERTIFPIDDVIDSIRPGMRIAFCDLLDSETALVQLLAQQGKWDLWAVPVKTGEPIPLLDHRFNEAQAKVSPDGKTLAYVSDESGRLEVYVLKLPSMTDQIRVSIAGGSLPRWRSDGKELYYLNEGGVLTAVQMNYASGVAKPGVPEPLFPVGRSETTNHLAPHYSYDVAEGGRRFVALAPEPTQPSSPLRVIVDWEAALESPGQSIP